MTCHCGSTNIHAKGICRRCYDRIANRKRHPHAANRRATKVKRSPGDVPSWKAWFTDFGGQA